MENTQENGLRPERRKRRSRKDYYEKHKRKLLNEKGTTYDKEYYEANPDIYYEAHKRYYEKNKEYLKAYGREYYQKNRNRPAVYKKPRREECFEEIKRLRELANEKKVKLVLFKKQIIVKEKEKIRIERRIGTIDNHLNILNSERVRKVDELQKIKTWLNENKIE